MVTSFPHPSEGANYDVSCILDPPHVIKLVRNTLGDLKEITWKEKTENGDAEKNAEKRKAEEDKTEPIPVSAEK